MAASHFLTGARTVVATLSAGLLVAALGVPGAGAEEEPLCAATKSLADGEHKHEASLVRSHLGCRVSDDPGPADPGKE
jgi:hypothetical protein